MFRFIPTTLLSAFLLFSCQHFGAHDFARNLAQRHNLTHIQSGCSLVDLNGQLVHAKAGTFCLFLPDGSSVVYASSGKLIRYDRNLKEIWHREILLNHQLKVAEFENGYLSIQDVFYPGKEGSVRYDAIVFIDAQGKVTKSYNIKKYFDELNRKFAPWKMLSTDGTNKFEFTHFNSIYETYKIVNGSKVHTGYVAHDRFSKQMFFFDVGMTRITKIIEMEDRSSHDVAPISEDEYVFYMNYDSKKEHDPNPNLRSSIQIYSEKSGQFRKIYENPSRILTSKVCSSVQYLPPSDLVIFHSNCPSELNHPSKKSALEFVDLKAGESKVIEFDKYLDRSGEARLVDARSFFKNIGAGF